MALRTLLRKLDRLEGAAAVGAAHGAGRSVLARLRSDPSAVLTLAGVTPDPWQAAVLASGAPRSLLLCSRQAGKSSVAAALALRTALLRPHAPVLLGPSQRQSAELFRKAVALFDALGRPVRAAAESALRLELANGSRLLALPGGERSVRCFGGVALLVLDEAARVPDALYRAVRPMLAVSGGPVHAVRAAGLVLRGVAVRRRLGAGAGDGA